MAKGFIKFSRELLEELTQNPNMLAVFAYLLYRANYRGSTYNGIELQRGEVAVTYNKISAKCNVTVSQTRTAIKNLILTGRIAVKRYPKFSVVSILNYNEFQGVAGRKAVESQTNRRQADSQIAPSKEIINNNKEECISSCSNYIAKSHEENGDGGDDENKMNAWGKHGNVMLSEKQAEALLKKMSLDEFNYYLEKLDNFIFSKNAVVASHYKTILKWLKEDRNVEQ